MDFCRDTKVVKRHIKCWQWFLFKGGNQKFKSFSYSFFNNGGIQVTIGLARSTMACKVDIYLDSFQPLTMKR